MKQLSAVIITKNEERVLSLCLSSLQGIVDEIVIADSGSSDATLDIAKQFNAIIFMVDWKGYAQTKNEANNKAINHWILSIDADEVLDEELKKAILTWKKTNKDTFLELNRLTQYCGKWIKHCGWYPEYKLRIFNRNQAKWEGDFVHEKLVVSSNIKTERVAGNLLHYSFPTVAKHIEKVNHFSTLAAQEALKKGKKTNILKILVKPPLKFFSVYVLKLGFLEGVQGLSIAGISAFDKFLRELKIYFNQ